MQMMPKTISETRRSANNLLLFSLLLLALVLRLGYGMTQNPMTPYTDRGGDTAWYLDYGHRLVSGSETGPLSPPPLYLIFVGLPQLVLTPESATVFIRVMQALLSAATCYFAYRTARVIAGERAGLVALGAFAIHPIFLMESANITSETLYLFFVSASLAAYIETVRRPSVNLALRFAGVGLLFACATLTRAAFLLFPVGIAVHLFLSCPPRRALQYAVALLLTFAVGVSTWSLYYKLRWDEWIIAGEGLAGFLYLGTVGWEGPFQTDERLIETASPELRDAPREEQYVAAASQIIQSDVGAYVTRRVRELANAYITPHGVYWFPGESLRALASTWIDTGFSRQAFQQLIGGDAFLPKLLFYVVHFSAIALGILGAWATRHEWRLTLPLIGFIAYVSLVHLVLYALPRYIFPATYCYVLFAALWLARSVFRNTVTDAPTTEMGVLSAPVR